MPIEPVEWRVTSYPPISFSSPPASFDSPLPSPPLPSFPFLSVVALLLPLPLPLPSVLCPNKLMSVPRTWHFLDRENSAPQ